MLVTGGAYISNRGICGMSSCRWPEAMIWLAPQLVSLGWLKGSDCRAGSNRPKQKVPEVSRMPQLRASTESKAFPWAARLQPEEPEETLPYFKHLGNSFQSPTTPTFRKFFLMFSLNPSCFSVNSLPLTVFRAEMGNSCSLPLAQTFELFHSIHPPNLLLSRITLQSREHSP